jgi:hypothetical protein
LWRYCGDRWIALWSTFGLTAIEGLIGDDGYCVGGALTMADVFIVPEVYAARRFKVDLEPFERIRRVERRRKGLEAFQLAHPSRSPTRLLDIYAAVERRLRVKSEIARGARRVKDFPVCERSEQR